MSNQKISILIIDEDVANLTYFTIVALGITKRYNIHVLSTRKDKLYPVKFSRYVTSFHQVERGDDDAFIAKIIQFAQLFETSLLFPVTEPTMKLFSRHAAKFSTLCRFPKLAAPETLELITNKWLLHNWLVLNKFPVKLAVLYSKHNNDFNVQAAKLEFPVLIKPLSKSAGTGIHKFGSHDQLIQFFQSGKAIFGDYIIQEFIQGYDIDISLIAYEGQIVRFTIQRGLTVGVNRFSTHISFEHDPELEKIAVEIIRKLNFTGIAHLDFRKGPDGLYYLVDFNARFWSSLLGSVNAGINFPDEWCKFMLGENSSDNSYAKVKYMLSGEAVKAFLKSIKTFKVTFNYKNSQLRYNFKDPIPPIMFLIKKQI